MANIGKPVRQEPLVAPAPWEWPEPQKEDAPAKQPAEPVKTPEKTPA